MERRAHVGSRSPVVKCVVHALLMRYSHAGSRWWSLWIESRIMWCALFSRQSRYCNATHALMTARQSFWIIRVHRSPAFSIIFNFALRDRWRWAPRCDRPITLLHKICSMCGCPLSNIWHVFFLKKCSSDEQLILKANKLQNQSLSVSHL